MKTFKALGAAALLSTSLLGAVTSFAASDGKEYQPSPDKTQTPVKATFTLPDDGSDNNKPSNPDTGNPENPDQPTNPENPGNKPNNPTGPFGIAYQPFLWDAGSNELQDSGEQTFKFKGDDFHVGVKDKTRQDFGWKLNASLQWTDDELAGASITTENTTGTVKNNVSTEKEPNKYEDVNGEVTGASNFEITTSPSTIMTGVKGQLHMGTYDYALTNATLKIMDTTKVQAGDYTGNVNWELSRSDV